MYRAPAHLSRFVTFALRPVSANLAQIAFGSATPHQVASALPEVRFAAPARSRSMGSPPCSPEMSRPPSLLPRASITVNKVVSCEVDLPSPSTEGPRMRNLARVDFVGGCG
jgi:hypothetical protein